MKTKIDVNIKRSPMPRSTVDQRLLVYQAAMTLSTDELDNGLCFVLQWLSNGQPFENTFEDDIIVDYWKTAKMFPEFGQYYDRHKQIDKIDYPLKFTELWDEDKPAWRRKALRSCIRDCKRLINARPMTIKFKTTIS